MPITDKVNISVSNLPSADGNWKDQNTDLIHQTAILGCFLVSLASRQKNIRTEYHSADKIFKIYISASIFCLISFVLTEGILTFEKNVDLFLCGTGTEESVDKIFCSQKNLFCLGLRY